MGLRTGQSLCLVGVSLLLISCLILWALPSKLDNLGWARTAVLGGIGLLFVSGFALAVAGLTMNNKAIAIRVLVPVAVGLMAVAFYVGLFYAVLPNATQCLLSSEQHYVFYSIGRKTTYLPNSCVDRLLSEGDRNVDDLVAALSKPDLNERQVCAIDAVLWSIVAKCPPDQINPWGSFVRPRGKDQGNLIIASWRKWQSSGKPMREDDGKQYPDLKDYPNIDKAR